MIFFLSTFPLFLVFLCCSLVFKKKLHSCAKNIALHCHKNETSYRKQSIERSFKSSRPIQERRYCNGMYVQFPHPPLKPGQCEESYFEERHKCEESFVAVYKKNKGDKSLCRYVELCYLKCIFISSFNINQSYFSKPASDSIINTNG